MLWFALTALAVAVLVALLGLFLWCFGLVLRRLAGVLVPMAFALILTGSAAAGKKAADRAGSNARTAGSFLGHAAPTVAF